MSRKTRGNRVMERGLKGLSLSEMGIAAGNTQRNGL